MRHLHTHTDITPEKTTLLLAMTGKKPTFKTTFIHTVGQLSILRPRCRESRLAIISDNQNHKHPALLNLT